MFHYAIERSPENRLSNLIKSITYRCRPRRYCSSRALRDWLTAQRRRLSAKNPLAKAIQYALSRWQALTRYAGDGRLAIDNNVAERALRGIAIGRKNYLFAGSDAGSGSGLLPDRDRQG